MLANCPIDDHDVRNICFVQYVPNLAYVAKPPSPYERQTKHISPIIMELAKNVCYLIKITPSTEMIHHFSSWRLMHGGQLNYRDLTSSNNHTPTHTYIYISPHPLHMHPIINFFLWDRDIFPTYISPFMVYLRHQLTIPPRQFMSIIFRVV